MIDADNRLDNALDAWAGQRRLSDARAAAIHSAVLRDGGESDLPAFSHQWWQQLMTSALRPLQRNRTAGRYLPLPQ